MSPNSHIFILKLLFPGIYYHTGIKLSTTNINFYFCASNPRAPQTQKNHHLSHHQSSSFFLVSIISIIIIIIIIINISVSSGDSSSSDDDL
jgi:hypothetical protein